MSTVEAIFVYALPGAPPTRVAAVHARAGLGLDGDHHQGQPRLFGTAPPADQLTLIEAEALDLLAKRRGIRLAPGASRRNLVTRGVALNDLVGRTFRIGPVHARGVELCDPCSRLEDLTRPGVLRGLVNRGGLRAELLTDGVIEEGAAIVVDG